MDVQNFCSMCLDSSTRVLFSLRYCFCGMERKEVFDLQFLWCFSRSARIAYRFLRNQELLRFGESFEWPNRLLPYQLSAKHQSVRYLKADTVLGNYLYLRTGMESGIWSLILNAATVDSRCHFSDQLASQEVLL